jgi:stage II sporulation protein R
MNKVLLFIKEFGSIQRNNMILRIGLAIVLFSALTIGVVFANFAEKVNKGLADNLIRLHVIANSDASPDQSLKRDVRDIVLNFMKEKLKDSKDIEQTKYIINESRKEIEKLASAEIIKQGKNYSVKTMLGSFPFPTKAYGDITLPAGNYQALRVVIGKGEGANWWCVLFPPLCFVDASHGVVPESVKQTLKDTLTKEEYKIIASTDSDDEIPVKIKFKIVELFQDSKVKFNVLLSRIF